MEGIENKPAETSLELSSIKQGREAIFCVMENCSIEEFPKALSKYIKDVGDSSLFPGLLVTKTEDTSPHGKEVISVSWCAPSDDMHGSVKEMIDHVRAKGALALGCEISHYDR